jgi:hypothetical protein
MLHVWLSVDRVLHGAISFGAHLLEESGVVGIATRRMVFRIDTYAGCYDATYLRYVRM